MDDLALKVRRSGHAAPAASGAAGSGCRYWAFLSYAHEDSAAADRLHKALEKFRTPAALVGRPHPLGSIPQRLAPIFRDRQELAASSDLSRTIREALSQSRYFLVLCSPAAAASPWVDQEIRDFKKIHGEERVLAAIVDGEPFAAERGEEAAECFPPSLRQRVDSRGRLTSRRAEPIAADLRDNADGWRIGQLKLVAGMLGVGLDDLVQRDQARRQRRMTWIAAASLSGMALTSGLAAVAIDARDAARDERREAEGLVAFMLGDLREELEPIGELDSLDKVGARALAYYERQDKDSLSDDQLAQRSKALTLLGEIASSRNDLPGALARYREAMRGTEELLERSPDDPERLFDHAQNVFYVGDIRRKQGDLAAAEQAFQHYLSLAARMIAADPGNPTYKLEQKYAQTNLGVVQYERGRYPQATRTFEASLPLLARLIAREPGNADYWKSRIETHAWLADSKLGEWRMAEALAERQRGLAFLEQARTRFPRDVTIVEKAIPFWRSIARLQASNGDVATGIRSAQTGLAISNRLLAIEPGNMNWRQKQAEIRLELATMLLDRGLVRDAAGEVDKACATRSAARDDAAAVDWRRIAIHCLRMGARVALATGNAGQALVLAGESLAAARRYRSGIDANDRLEVALAHKLVGDILLGMGDRQASRQSYAAGLAAWPENFAEIPRTAAIRAALLRGTGRIDEARELEVRLRRIGYRKLI